MHGPAALIAGPRISLEQHHITRRRAFDRVLRADEPALRVVEATRGMTEARAIHRRIVEEFGGRAAVGADEPQNEMIDVKPRTHRLLELCETHADRPDLDEIAEHLNPCPHILRERG